MAAPGAIHGAIPRVSDLRDAGIAGVVALALAAPLVGLHAVSEASGLTLETRFAEAAIAVVLVAVGRLAVSLLRRGDWMPALVLGTAMAGGGMIAQLPSAFLDVVSIGGGAVLAGAAGLIFARRAGWLAIAPAEPAATHADTVRWLVPALIAVVAVLPLLPAVDRRFIDIAILVMTYVMLGWGLNIVVGLAGLLDLGYVAFYAVGAYSYALLAQTFGLGFWECLPLAGMFAAMFGITLGFPVLRLRGDYLAIVTLGFGEMVRVTLINWTSLTNGPDGIGSIPRPSFFGFQFTANPADGTTAFHDLIGIAYSSTHRIIFLYYLILILALLTCWFTLRIRKLPLGRAWEALREDEIASRALGINPTTTKLSAFAIGAMFAGFAGSFFATRQGFISPESFTFIESALILAIVVLGGMGSQLGIVIAAVVLIGLPEWFRDLQEYRMLAFGAGMVLIMIWRPRGLVSHREPTIRLAPVERGG